MAVPMSGCRGRDFAYIVDIHPLWSTVTVFRHEARMINKESLEDSPDLSERLRFWRALDPSLGIVDPVSGRAVADELRSRGSDGRHLREIAGEMKSFVEMAEKTPGLDMVYHRPMKESGGICRVDIEWRDLYDNFGKSNVIFVAADEAAAIKAVFRYVVAQQVSMPDVNNLLLRVRLKKISFDAINEFGQMFHGAPDCFFEWNRNGHSFVADDGDPVSFDFAVLVAAGSYAGMEPNRSPVLP